MSLLRRAWIAPLLLAGVLPVALSLGSPAASAAVPVGFTDTLVTGNVEQATDLAAVSGGRLLVTLRKGVVTLVRADGTTAAVLDLSAQLCTTVEQGLLGIAADPAFNTNGYIYLYYSSNEAGCAGNGTVNRVSRFTMTGETATLASELPLLFMQEAAGTGNHDGGGVRVGKDGNLYVSVGESGQPTRAPDLGVLNGKVLRIALDGLIPPGNPYASGGIRCNTTGGTIGGTKCAEVFASGLRNPWRLATDQNAATATARLFINDVGEVQAEEFDELAAGANYGWPAREGLCERGGRSNCGDPGGGLTNPLADYTREAGCVTIGGGAFVTNGAWGAAYDNGYLAADVGCGKIFLFRPGAPTWSRSEFATGVGPVSAMAMVDDLGGSSLYYTSLSGELHKISFESPAVTSSAGAFTPLTPTRILDTRNGIGYSGAKPGNGSVVSLQAAGANGIPPDAVAVSVNLTGTESAGPGFVTMYPDDESQPLASSLNFTTANETVANAALIRLPASGRLNLFTQRSAHLVVDVTGYWKASGPAQSGRFVPASVPARLLDTRVGNGAPTALLGAFGSVDLQVTGRGGVPASGVSAVAMVVTVADSVRAGFITVWPTGQPQPNASSLNAIGPNDFRSNLVIVPVGSVGKVTLLAQSPTDLVADVAGWFTDSTAPSSTTGLYVASSPRRLLDTRAPQALFSRLDAGDIATVKYTARVSAGAIALVHNLTVDATGPGGFLTAYPTGSALPLASNVNWSGANQTRASATISNLANAGQVNYYAKTATDLIVDISGWFTG